MSFETTTEHSRRTWANRFSSYDFEDVRELDIASFAYAKVPTDMATQKFERETRKGKRVSTRLSCEFSRAMARTRLVFSH